MIKASFPLFTPRHICCGYLLESPRRGDSNKYPQHMFLGVLNTVCLNISNYLPHLKLRNRSIQIVVITNFVVISSVIKKRFDSIYLFIFSCYFDGVKGTVATICFTTVPLFLVLIMNIVLYALTWKKIHTETKRIRRTLGSKPTSVKAEHRAAKAMSLFVAAFFIQWWALSIYGIWALVGHVPEEYFYLLITFDNFGGVLNLCVYVIIRRKNLTQGERSSVHARTDTDITRCSSQTGETRFSDIYHGSDEQVYSLDQRM